MDCSKEISYPTTFLSATLIVQLVKKGTASYLEIKVNGLCVGKVILNKVIKFALIGSKIEISIPPDGSYSNHKRSDLSKTKTDFKISGLDGIGTADIRDFSLVDNLVDKKTYNIKLQDTDIRLKILPDEGDDGALHVSYKHGYTPIKV